MGSVNSSFRADREPNERFCSASPLATQYARTKGDFWHEPRVPNLICWPGFVSSIPVRPRRRPGVSMTITLVGCSCGIVEVQLTGEPIAQYVCHCDDCQAVHGKAYPVALYADSAVVVTRGELGASIVKTTPRTRCSGCGQLPLSGPARVSIQ